METDVLGLTLQTMLADPQVAAAMSKASTALQPSDIGVSVQAQLSAGTIAQYRRGDGSLATFPSIPSVRKVETFSGVTNGSGNYTVTFATPYAAIPDIQPQMTAGGFNQFIRITARSVNGFTVQVAQRNSVNLLGIDVLLATTAVVSGAAVNVLVTEFI